MQLVDIVVLIVLGSHSVSSFTSCRDAFSCAHLNVTDTSTDTTGYIECAGYKSCYNATVIENKEPNGATIMCHGSYSCENANSIKASNYSTISCYGLSSCTNIRKPFISTVNAYIDCYGELSCANSKFYTIDSEVHCKSDRSCKNSIFQRSKNNWFSGHLAGLNAVFLNNVSDIEYTYNGSGLGTDSTSYYQSYYYFEGRDSGYNTTIYCNDNQICNIECHSNACNNLNLICNGNCTFNIDCDYAEYSDNACRSNISSKLLTDSQSFKDTFFESRLSDGNKTVIFYQLPSLLNKTITDYDNSIALYSNRNGLHCDDTNECRNRLQLNNSNGGIYCTAYYSCKGVGDISIYVNISEILTTNVTHSPAIRFDGYESGVDVGNIVAQQDGSDIFFSGAGYFTTEQGLYWYFCVERLNCR